MSGMSKENLLLRSRLANRFPSTRTMDLSCCRDRLCSRAKFSAAVLIQSMISLTASDILTCRCSAKSIICFRLWRTGRGGSCCWNRAKKSRRPPNSGARLNTSRERECLRPFPACWSENRWTTLMRKNTGSCLSMSLGARTYQSCLT